MRVILFRHGPAGRRDASRWPDDGERPVTRRGLAKTAHAADGLRRFLGRGGRVVTSPLERARQTAKVVSDALAPDGRMETLECLAPGAPVREALRWLRGLESGPSIILVGHEPHLGKLAGVLVFGASGSALPIKKAGALVIDFVGPVEPGAGKLYAFLPPRLLRRMGRPRSHA